MKKKKKEEEEANVQGLEQPFISTGMQLNIL
jgi:hypothetical protein